jgi:hypothetical protein
MKRDLKFCAIVLLATLFGARPGLTQDFNPGQASQSQSNSEANQGQQKDGNDSMQEMAGMHTEPTTLSEEVEQHSLSGTDVEPFSTPVSMLMAVKNSWMLMLHGVAFLNDVQQNGPRGADKLFSTNWIMFMAQHRLSRGTLTLRTMLSLEPATITGRFYPELFQQGETAFGKPIVDGQHPHNFVMEVAALYDFKLGERTLFSFYGGPVGDPALGPPAYPHRMSASEDPIAPLGHHLQDSTHIASDVLTGGITHRIFRLEASGFHGREPGENRWTIEQGPIDSWSTRFTMNPGQDWSGQYSFAHLTSPEVLQPNENIDRMTASVAYNRPLTKGNWASLLLWGRNKNLPGGLIWNSYLAESTLQFAGLNYIWGRIENVDRTNELLLKDMAEPANFVESVIGRVKAFTLGYDRDFKLIPRVASAAGGQVTFYGTPDALTALYGSHPVGVLVFVRLRLVPKER